MPQTIRKPLTHAQSLRLVDIGAEFIAVVEKLAAIAETVAHTHNAEAEILPTTDKARELIAQVKG